MFPSHDRFRDKEGIGFIEFEDHEIVRGKITELVESCYDNKPKIKYNLVEKEQKYNEVDIDWSFDPLDDIIASKETHINWQQTNNYIGDL